MSGWNNEKGMSNNAVTAYKEGGKPISKWTKKAIICAITAQNILDDETLRRFKKLTLKSLKKYILRSTEWHHTSKYFNETEFYFVKDLTELDADEIEELIIYAEKDDIEDKKYKNEIIECIEEDVLIAYILWTGSRSNPKPVRKVEHGIKKGNWVTLPGGGRKNVTSRNVEVFNRENLRWKLNEVLTKKEIENFKNYTIEELIDRFNIRYVSEKRGDWPYNYWVNRICFDESETEKD